MYLVLSTVKTWLKCTRMRHLGLESSNIFRFPSTLKPVATALWTLTSHCYLVTGWYDVYSN